MLGLHLTCKDTSHATCFGIACVKSVYGVALADSGKSLNFKLDFNDFYPQKVETLPIIVAYC